MDTARPEWERSLDAVFPGWLLPHASRRSLRPAHARAFLARLSGRRDHLALLQSVGLLNAERETLQRFVGVELPALVRVLPARTTVEQRTREGGFHGRLDVRATQQLHQAGHTTHFVTRSRRRDVSLPENVLVKRVCGRLLHAVDNVVDTAGDHHRWTAPLVPVRAGLRTLLHQTVLRDIDDVRHLRRDHRTAAGRAPHIAYATAVHLHDQLSAAFDDSSPERTAALLARGALWPLDAETRFELAVLLRLLDRLARHLRVADADSPWMLEHSLILSGRDEVARFFTADGRSLRVWYNTAPAALQPGRRHSLVQHYLTAGRQRPDLTLCRSRPGAPDRWAVVEVKHTTDPGYVRVGLGEALLYDHEYGDQLAGWPRALVVAPIDVVAPPSRADGVVLEGWSRWPSPEVLEGLVDGLA